MCAMTSSIHQQGKIPAPATHQSAHASNDTIGFYKKGQGLYVLAFLFLLDVVLASFALRLFARYWNFVESLYGYLLIFLIVAGVILLYMIARILFAPYKVTLYTQKNKVDAHFFTHTRKHNLEEMDKFRHYVSAVSSDHKGGMSSEYIVVMRFGSRNVRCVYDLAHHEEYEELLSRLRSLGIPEHHDTPRDDSFLKRFGGRW